MFPSSRLRYAGATDDELAQLEADHEASAPGEQAALESYFAGVSQGMLTEWLDTKRAAGLASDAPEEASPETTDSDQTGLTPEVLIGTEGEGSGSASNNEEGDADENAAPKKKKN